MGAWGYNILDDDVAADVRGDYFRLYNLGKTHEQIVDELCQNFAEELADSDDASSVWFAIARSQWECGVLAESVFTHVQNIIETGQGLERWAEEGGKSLAKRQKALSAFLSKLQTTNPRPRKPRKPIIRNPIFQPGDCLAIRLSDGDYAAAIVLEHPPEKTRPGDDTYGLSLIGLLDYKSTTIPGREIFEKRQWLKLPREPWCNKEYIVNVIALGFRKMKERFEVVARTPLNKDDPRQERIPVMDNITTPRYPVHTGWEFAEDIIDSKRKEGD